MSRAALGAGIEKRSGPSSWAPANMFTRAVDMVKGWARTLPAVAAVTLALSFGSGMTYADTAVQSFAQPAAVLQTVVPPPATEVAQTPATYTVRDGDNLTTIARQFNTTPQELARLNDLRTPNLIKPDQVLRLPSQVSADQVSAVVNAQTPRAPRATGVSPRVDAPATYRVESGDNLSLVSQRTGVSIHELVRLNDIRGRHLVIHPKQILKLTDGVEDRETAVATVQTRTPVRAVDVTAPVTTAGISHFPPADQAIFTRLQPRLHWGMEGHAVQVLQTRLTELGYPIGAADSNFGGRTRSALRAFQALNSLEGDAVVGVDTWRALASADSVRLPTDGVYPIRSAYRPYSADAYRLFLRAASDAGVPADWAIADSLHRLVDAESDGEVGRPNYTYGRRANRPSEWPDIHAELRRGRITATSSATGIGQLLLSNVEAHYPSGRAGINNPLEEAVGMLSYIQDRHTTPDRAWRNYNSVHEGY